MVLPATLDPSAPLDNTLGALYVGVIVSAVLYGLCLLQAFLYFQKYKDDLWYIKLAVITLLLFDTTHLLMVAAGVYHYTIANYHNQENLRYLHWTFLIEALFVGVNGGIVQLFFTFRVWRLSKGNFLLCGFIVLLVFGQVGGGTAWVIRSMGMKTYQDLLRLNPLAISVNAVSCSIDVLIAGSLCVLLERAKTGFKRSDTIINKIIIFVINTGLLTSIFAVISLIFLLASKLTIIYGAFYICLGHLYTNSFLATLNTRSGVSSRVDDTEMKPGTFSPQGTTARNINILIETTRDAAPDASKPMSGIETKDQVNSDDNYSIQKGHHL